MKSKLIAMLMVAGSTMFAGPRVFVGLNVGVPVAPIAPVAVVAPAPIGYAPGPGYVWVGGYYNFVGGRRIWNAGYWRAPIGVGFNHGFAGRGYARGFRR
jgi:hypothetical protein